MNVVGISPQSSDAAGALALLQAAADPEATRVRLEQLNAAIQDAAEYRTAANVALTQAEELNAQAAASLEEARKRLDEARLTEEGNEALRQNLDSRVAALTTAESEFVEKARQFDERVAADELRIQQMIDKAESDAADAAKAKGEYEKLLNELEAKRARIEEAFNS